MKKERKSSFIPILIKISCCKSESGRNQNSDIPLRNLNVVNNWFFRFNLHQDFVWVKDYIFSWNLFMHIHQGLAQCTTVVSAQNENLDLPSYTSLYPNNMDNLPNYDSIQFVINQNDKHFIFLFWNRYYLQNNN